MSYKTLAVSNASRETHLESVPKLKHGNDDERAAQLEVYIDQAESGLRSILMAGFFLECLADELPKGKLGPWVEAHCKRKWRTVQRWKQVAASIGEAVGVNYKKRIDLKLHEVLALPLNKVPENLKPVREKIDNEIAGKSYRQLFLELKQAEEDDGGDLKPKRGRLKGQGGATKEQRAKAAAAEAQAEIDAMELDAEDFNKWMDKVDNLKGLPRVSDKVFEKHFARVKAHYDFLRSIKDSRGGAR